jgi:hypothetical protein
MQIRIDGPQIQEGDPQQDPLSHPPTFSGVASHASPARPAAYYGEIDHPSSEDEDEALLQKEGLPPTPGRAEQGSLEPEDPKVCQYTFVNDVLGIYLLMASLYTAAIFRPMSCILTHFSGCICGDRWHCSREFL